MTEDTTWHDDRPAATSRVRTDRARRHSEMRPVEVTVDRHTILKIHTGRVVLLKVV
jgi:hypothetical protein